MGAHCSYLCGKRNKISNLKTDDNIFDIHCRICGIKLEDDDILFSPTPHLFSLCCSDKCASSI